MVPASVHVAGFVAFVLLLSLPPLVAGLAYVGRRLAKRF